MLDIWIKTLLVSLNVVHTWGPWVEKANETTCRLSMCCRMQPHIAACRRLPCLALFYDDVIKWKRFPRYWSFVWGIHRSPVNSPHKGQCSRTLMFSLISAGISGWVNNREYGDLRRNDAHYDVTVMFETVNRSIIAGRFYPAVTGINVSGTDVNVTNSLHEALYWTNHHSDST